MKKSLVFAAALLAALSGSVYATAHSVHQKNNKRVELKLRDWQVNQASLSDWKSLKGVGEKSAHAVIDYKEKNGPFTNVGELNKVKGFSPKHLKHMVDLNHIQLVFS